MPAMPEFSPFLDLALRHLPLALLAVGLVFALLTLAVLPKPHRGETIVEVLFRSYLFWGLGVFFLYEAAARGAFGAEAGAAVRAPAGPPLPEAAFAALAFAVIAFLALGRSTGLRIAAVVGPAVYLLGPLVATEPTPGLARAHAGEMALAVIGALLLVLQTNVGRVSTASRPAPLSGPVAEPPATSEAASAEPAGAALLG